MRNLKLLVLAFIFGSTTLCASERLDDKNTEIRDQIVNLLDNSKFEADENFKVEFTFTFNSSGEIVVLNVDSNRKNVKDYIRKHINSKKLQNPGVKNEIYTIPLTIKAI
ncbi:hypothetical protein [Lutibacter sp.]|uniref:hypothetical protein n=1 Tax=Lutibacter sp. TaxID=1925666 RepID=UPI00349FFCE3